MLLAILTPLTVTGCSREEPSDAQIAVTNSYLAATVRDIDPNIDVLTLAPPGMCPGHFDISPGQVRALRKCKLLILFDFQQAVADKLERLSEKGLQVRTVATQAGLCVPDTYLDCCRQVGEALARSKGNSAEIYNDRLGQIERRLKTLEQNIGEMIAAAGLANAAVITSYHQSNFARWAGLDVVSQFAGSDTETAANINDCIRNADGRGVKFVIANQQEGDALAKALAERLYCVPVVFSNFPDLDSDPAFDNNLKANINRLIEAGND